MVCFSALLPNIIVLEITWTIYHIFTANGIQIVVNCLVNSSQNTRNKYDHAIYIKMLIYFIEFFF